MIDGGAWKSGTGVTIACGPPPPPPYCAIGEWDPNGVTESPGPDGDYRGGCSWPWWFWIIVLVGPGVLIIGVLYLAARVVSCLDLGKRRARHAQGDGGGIDLSGMTVADRYLSGMIASLPEDQRKVVLHAEAAPATADQLSSSSAGADNMTVAALVDLLRARLGLSVDMNVAQVADAAVEMTDLSLPADTPLKDKLAAAAKSVVSSSDIETSTA